MKKCAFLVVFGLLLCGCSAQETFETVSDDIIQSVSAQMQQVYVELPEEAAAPAMENDGGDAIYLCDGYTITMQTLEAGDLDATLRTATGFSRDALHMIQTESEGIKRYECVWAAAGEGEDQVCRAAVLDDGSYHYVLTAMAGASVTETFAEEWNGMFRSFRLGSMTDPNTGS